MKKGNPNIEITWDNYKDYLDENDFLADCKRQDKITKANYLSADYFLENSDQDYSDVFSSMQNVLHIHGDADDKVPLASLNVKFSNQIIVSGGDHDLERPDMREQWVGKAIQFLYHD